MTDTISESTPAPSASGANIPEHHAGDEVAIVRGRRGKQEGKVLDYSPADDMYVIKFADGTFTTAAATNVKPRTEAQINVSAVVSTFRGAGDSPAVAAIIARLERFHSGITERIRPVLSQEIPSQENDSNGG